MKKNCILEIALTPVGRGVTALIGLVIVTLLLYHTGWENVLSTLSQAASFFPIIILFEVIILCCTMCALRLLYAEDREKLPLKALIRAGLVGYSLMGLIPAGR